MDTFMIWVLVYFVLASQFYIWDKKGGFFIKDFYLFLYNLGHRKELTREELDRGFVYNQPVGKKITFAIFFDIFISLIFWYFNTLGLGVKILLIFVGTPVIFFGFWFGGVLIETLAKVFKKTVKTIDDIETGKLNPTQKISEEFDEVSKNISSKAKEFVEDIEESFSTKESEKKSSQDSTKSKEEKKKEDDEALEALRKFQKGK